MTNRKESFVRDEFYHLYNRGNSKQDIFLDEQDYDRFSKLLYLSNSTKNFKFRDDIVDQKIDAYDFDRGEILVSIGAWVLMPNHFHLYITPSHRSDLGEDEGAVAIFMKKLCTAYSMYFNKKYKRSGSLYEGKFKSVHISNDEHAKYNFSYIHLNPIKLMNQYWRKDEKLNTDETLNFLNKYKWGSYIDFKGVKRQENKIINLTPFPEYFSNEVDFNEEIFEWLNYDAG